MKGILYWHPGLYRFALKRLYGKDYRNRFFSLLSKEIGSMEVLDVGCGDCQLAEYLHSGQYSGVDINKNFVRYAKKGGLNVSLIDLKSDEIPKAECIVMSGILNQLYPDHETTIKKALRRATEKLIIVEAAQHYTFSNSILVRILDYPGHNIKIRKFKKDELIELYKKFNADKIIVSRRDVLAVFKIKK